MTLAQADKATLLKFARKILEESFKDISYPDRTDWTERFLPLFAIEENVPSAAFVTLKKSGCLRGCVGTTLPEMPLLQTIAKMTLHSAFKDPRFKPLISPELAEVEIEISLLSPLTKINNLDQIVPNLHGVIVKNDYNSGVFLPQVWKQIPEKINFLKELCFSKAGLSSEAWKDPAVEIFIFTVDRFGERDWGMVS